MIIDNYQFRNMNLALINSAWEGADKCRDCAVRHLVLFADLKSDRFQSNPFTH